MPFSSAPQRVATTECLSANVVSITAINSCGISSHGAASFGATGNLSLASADATSGITMTALQSGISANVGTSGHKIQSAGPIDHLSGEDASATDGYPTRIWNYMPFDGTHGSGTNSAAVQVIAPNSKGWVRIAGKGALSATQAVVDVGNDETGTAGSAGRVYIRSNDTGSSAIKLDAVSVNAAGGITLAAGTGGLNFSSTGGSSTVYDGQLLLESTQAASDAVRIVASDTVGGISVEAGTGGVNVFSDGGLGVYGGAGQVLLASTQAAGTAIELQATDAAGGVTIQAGSGSTAEAGAGGVSVDASGKIYKRARFAGADALHLEASGAGGEINILASDSAGLITLQAGTGNVNVSGCSLVTAAPSSSISGLILSAGTASGAALVDGTVWYDGANVKIRVGGTTKQFTIV